ncbi:hypothetical protein BGZ79_001572 [Entomortierella chlamydospora]|nr:hypothetical protein BGZ79_001572 [Entomortierella chlamydospora]
MTGPDDGRSSYRIQLHRRSNCTGDPTAQAIQLYSPSHVGCSDFSLYIGELILRDEVEFSDEDEQNVGNANEREEDEEEENVDDIIFARMSSGLSMEPVAKYVDLQQDKRGSITMERNLILSIIKGSLRQMGS